MTTSINRLVTESKLEIALAEIIKEDVCKLMQKREITEDQLSTILGVFPTAVRGLMGMAWPIGTAIRVAEALGLKIHLSVVGVE